MTVLSVAIETSCIHGASMPCDDKFGGTGNDAKSLPTPTRSQLVMKLRSEVAHSRARGTAWHFRPSVGSWLASASRGKAAACAIVVSLQQKGVAALPTVDSVGPPSGIQSIAPPVHIVAPAASVEPIQAEIAHDHSASQQTPFAPSPRSSSLSPRSVPEACASEEVHESSPLTGASRLALAEDDAMLRSSPTQGSRPTEAEEDSCTAGSSTHAGVAPAGVASAGIAPVGIAPVGIAPVGVAPVGIAPVAVAPFGVAPVGNTPLGQ